MASLTHIAQDVRNSKLSVRKQSATLRVVVYLCCLRESLRRRNNACVGAYVTLPFSFELGQRRSRRSLGLTTAMKMNEDGSWVIYFYSARSVDCRWLVEVIKLCDLRKSASESQSVWVDIKTPPHFSAVVHGLQIVCRIQLIQEAGDRRPA